MTLNSKDVLAKLELFLKVTGLLVLLAGVVVGYLDLAGKFLDQDKQAFLQWVQTTGLGLPVSNPAAKKFMIAFPPPADSNPSEITHVTKNTFKVDKGPIQNAAINYMHRDGSRTSFVATLDD